jgi:hypothetical protein
MSQHSAVLSFYDERRCLQFTWSGAFDEAIAVHAGVGAQLLDKLLLSEAQQHALSDSADAHYVVALFEIFCLAYQPSVDGAPDVHREDGRSGLRRRRSVHKFILAAMVSAVTCAATLVALDVARAERADVAASTVPGYVSCSGALGSWAGKAHGRTGNFATADVAVFGDSMITSSWTAIRRSLTLRGQTLAVDYWSGRPTPPTVDAIVAAPVLPPVVIVASGSHLEASRNQAYLNDGVHPRTDSNGIGVNFFAAVVSSHLVAQGIVRAKSLTTK